MTDYIVSDTSLTSVADAIRAKTGGTANLQFPGEFVSEIGSISGGGEDNTKYLNLIARTGTSFEDDTIVTIGRGAFAHWTALQTLSLPNLVTIGDSCFQNCNNINNFYFPKATTIAAGNAFNAAGKATSTIVLPLLSSFPSMNAINNFGGNTVDLGANITTISTYMFNSSSHFNVLILRRDSLVALKHINAFNGSPFASGKAGGTLYVPQALIANYQVATNWSTILGYENNNIQSIEGSIYKTQYADGTPIPTS